MLKSERELSSPSSVTWQGVKTLQGTNRSPGQEKRRQPLGVNRGVAAADKQAGCAGKEQETDSLKGRRPDAQQV